jgi:endonuclease YncB( thermonuclease family)
MYKFEPFYRVKVDEVIDGDTLVISFYMGLGIWLDKQKVRLLGINAPENTGDTREQGLKVTKYLTDLLSKSSDVIVRTDEGKKGKYGRFLVVVYGNLNGKWENLNKHLVSAGAAQSYMAADATDAKDVFDPPPEEIERRVTVDEAKTEQEVYHKAEVVTAMLKMAKEVLSVE